MLQLIILGLLFKKDLHPYEVMHIMKERAMENYIKINYGTLYYNVEQLHKRGDITVKEVVHEGNRPDKTVYTITSQGRERFMQLLHKQFQDSTPMYHPLHPALMFTQHADPFTVRQAMERRGEKLEENIHRLRGIMEGLEGQIHWANMHIMKNGLMHKEIELKWVRQFLEELAEKGL